MSFIVATGSGVVLGIILLTAMMFIAALGNVFSLPSRIRHDGWLSAIFGWLFGIIILGAILALGVKYLMFAQTVPGHWYCWIGGIAGFIAGMAVTLSVMSRMGIQLPVPKSDDY